MCSISLALMAAGTAVQAGGQIAQGRTAQALSYAQASEYERQAEAERRSSAYEQMREHHKQDMMAASARAQIGASGVGGAGGPRGA